MGKMRLSYTLGVLISVLSAAIIVHGQSQSQEPSTTSDQFEGTPSLPSSSSEMTSSTEYATAYYSSSTSSPQSISSTTEDTKLSDCSTPIDLKVYCANVIPPEEIEFFNDTTIMGIMAKLIGPRTIYALQEQCVPGNWCLADSYRKELTDKKGYFYNTPVCQSDPVWTCLEKIQIRRRQCNESELIYLMSTIGVMCDMDAIEGGVISNECFTRSLEAIHVFYSDISRNVQDEDEENLCTNYNKQMSNTYACAWNSCDLEQRVFLEDFVPWSHISAIAEEVMDTLCNVELQCQGGYPTPAPNAPVPVSSSTNSQYNPSSGQASDLENVLDQTEVTEEERLNEKINEIEAVIEAEEAVEKIEEELFEMSTTSYMQDKFSDDSNSDSNSQGEEEIINEQGMDVPESQADVDQTFVYGMVTVTVVVVISLTLMGVMAFKRFSRLRKNYKLGYSQMTEEESRMLRNEYN